MELTDGIERDAEGYAIGSIAWEQKQIRLALVDFKDIIERIARAQEGMLAIAAEARQERLKLSGKLQEALKRPFDEEKHGA